MILLRDPHWEVALRLLNDWTVSDEEVIAPPLLYAEITSIVRERMLRGDLTIDEAKALVTVADRTPMAVFMDGTRLQHRALELATRFNHPKAYDAQYLAVADLLGCDLWTADRRLYRNVHRDLPWVRYVEEAA
jgi:predicted nucleic acid-binding protein